MSRIKTEKKIVKENHSCDISFYIAKKKKKTIKFKNIYCIYRTIQMITDNNLTKRFKEKKNYLLIQVYTNICKILQKW